jgi:uncharacterized protein (TIGR02145 family)
MKKQLTAVALATLMSGSVFAACSADINMNTKKITNLGTATDSADAISLGQMESVLATYVAGGSLTATVGTVSDEAGNSYTTRQIGVQTWMTQNLRNTAGLTQGTSSNWTDGSTNKYAWGGGTIDEQDDSEADKEKYGVYYQWNAAMNSESPIEGGQGMCPTGWHVPSDNDWQLLENAIGEVNTTTFTASCLGDTGWRYGSNGDGSSCDTTDAKIGNSLKSAYFDNKGGVLAGVRGSSSGDMASRGTNAHFWSSNGSGVNAFRRYLNSDKSSVYRGEYNKANGLSVRCLKD